MALPSLFIRKLLRASGPVALCVALASCGLFSSNTPHLHAKRHVKQHHYLADAYALHLSLAAISLSENPDNLSAANADIDVVQNYASGTQKSPALQPVIIISYTLKNNADVQRVIAPYTASAKQDEFPGVLKILQILGATHATLHDVSPAVIAISPPGALDLPEDNAERTAQTLQGQLNALLQNAKTLPPIAEAQMQIRMARYFTATHMQEAAYIAAENAKQSLAKIASTPLANSPTTQNLLQQLDEVEDKLHKTMPYTL